MKQQNCPIGTALGTTQKSHCEFLLPPKEGEGQDEGALVYLPRFLQTTVIALAAFALTSCAQTNSQPVAPKNFDATTGRTLFLKNCAHCHGADAHGDEGPDLHALDWTDNQIATRIRNGKKGQMTSFAGKLTPEQITTLVAYVRTLK